MTQSSLKGFPGDCTDVKGRWRAGGRSLLALSALSLAAMIVGSSSLAQVSTQVGSIREETIQEEFPAYHRMPAQSQSGWQARQSLFARQLAPDCGLAGLELDTVDANLWARLKLNYQRHCYKQAEMLLRRQLQRLAAIQPPPPVDATTTSSRHISLGTLKLLALAVADAPMASGGVAADDAAPVPSVVAPAATGDVTETIPSDGLATGAPAKDAQFYLEQGIVSYHDGDLPAAIADFDIVIQLDANFENAYIDRGIILYRMRELNRAFDDIAQAVHIENSHRACESTAPEGVALSK